MENCRDYRIGNLVRYEGSYDDERFFEIHTIAEEFPTLNTIEFGIGVVDWNNLKPITLTDKWFEKFGFTKEKAKLYEDTFEDFYVRQVYDYKYCFFYRAWLDNWTLYIEYTDSPFPHDTDKKYPIAFSIKYVHQLQNLFHALTRKELKVE